MKKLVVALATLLSVAVASASEKDGLAAVMAEPVVLDAAWTDDGDALWVGVLDDGSRRDGLASYLCIVLAEHDAAAGTRVRVMDIAAASQSAKTLQLGEADC